MGIQVCTTLKVEFRQESFNVLSLVLRDSVKHNRIQCNESKRIQLIYDVKIIRADIKKSMLINGARNTDAKIGIEFTAKAIAKLDCLLQVYEISYPDFLTSEEIRRNAVNKIYADLHKAGYR